MKNLFKKSVLVFLTLSSLLFSGCNYIEISKVKLGLKNLDFEFIKENKIDKIIIQSTRDPGFRFIVTDKKTITSLYDILSKSKKVSEKSSLEPDYVFEMYEGESNVHKYNYVTGLEAEDVGNLYNNDGTYIVSKRIDNDIIKNLWTLRKPREFEKIYYGAILEVIETYKANIQKEGRIGINISDDVDIAKYIFSTDLEKFKNDLANVLPTVELVNKNREEFDILLTVKTLGYKTDKYRSKITVYNKKEKSELEYYTGCRHENGEWDIDIGEKPFDP